MNKYFFLRFITNRVDKKTHKIKIIQLSDSVYTLVTFLIFKRLFIYITPNGNWKKSVHYVRVKENYCDGKF